MPTYGLLTQAHELRRVVSTLAQQCSYRLSTLESTSTAALAIREQRARLRVALREIEKVISALEEAAA